MDRVEPLGLSGSPFMDRRRQEPLGRDVERLGGRDGQLDETGGPEVNQAGGEEHRAGGEHLHGRPLQEHRRLRRPTGVDGPGRPHERAEHDGPGAHGVDGPAAGHPLDGHSLVPYLLKGARPPERDLFWRTRTEGAVRRGKWKYLRRQSGETLHDLTADPREQADLAARHPDVLRALRDRWQEIDKELLPYEG